MKRVFLVGYVLVGPDSSRHTNRSFVDYELAHDQLITRDIILNMEHLVINEWREMGLNVQHARIFAFQEISR